MSSPFTYCLNTSTIAGQKLSLVEEIDLAADAGYGAIEPWISEILAYRDAGGSLADLRKRVADRGLIVASAIGFAPWIIDDGPARVAGMEMAKRDMDLVTQIGGRYIAAPPMGHHERAGLDLVAAARRYAELFDLGQSMGVTPLLEIWGGSKSLSRLGEALLIAAESRRDACLLLDVYHLHKGGSGHAGLKLLNGRRLPVFHVNDYPATPDRDDLSDADRVYPGDGVAPLREIFATLREIGATSCLSLELFNKQYWAQDAREVLKTGLSKMRAVVEAW